MAKIFLLACSLLPSCFLSAQVFQKSRFRIIEFPNQINTSSKEDINKALVDAKNATEAFGLINRRLSSFKNASVRIREKIQDGTFRYYVYLVSASEPLHTSIVNIKGGRGVTEENVYHLYQFKTLLSDTVVIIDTFIVGIYPVDFTLNIGDYYMVIKNVGRAEDTLRLKNTGSELLFISDLLLPLIKGTPHCILFNRTGQSETLTDFYIHLLSISQTDELKSVAEDLIRDHKEDKAYTINELAVHLENYCRTSWGTIPHLHLIHWLKKQFPNDF